MENPFASRKFIYAVTGVIMLLVVSYLPVITAEFGLELSPDAQDMLIDAAPQVIILVLALIGGHALTDIVSIWRDYQPPQEVNITNDEAVK